MGARSTESTEPPRRHYARRRYWIAAALVAASGLAGWGFWIEPGSLVVRSHRLELPGWTESCAGVRLAVVGDLHVGSPRHGLETLERIVTEIEQQSPDLVLLPGDFVIDGVLGGEPVAPEAIAHSLARLARAHPVYAVLGNHDHWLDAGRVLRALESAGISVLENRARQVRVESCSFWLAGLADLWAGQPDVTRATRGIPTDALAIALTHNPDLFPVLSPRFALVVAAHTHGGQVQIPGLGRLVVPSRFGERYAIGHIVESGRHLFVNPGTGTSILPVRFLVPPEVSLLELQPTT